MKYCKNCKVKIDSERDYCPLCFRESVKINDEVSTPLFAERKTNETTVKRNLFVTKLFIFMSICAISVCLLINYFTGFELPWSLSVVSGILYCWILISHTIISRRGIFEKVLFQLLGIIFILWTSEKISTGHTWLWNYVFPSVSLCAICSLLMITFIRKDKSWILSFLTITFILIVVSLKNDNFLNFYFKPFYFFFQLSFRCLPIGHIYGNISCGFPSFLCISRSGHKEHSFHHKTSPIVLQCHQNSLQTEQGWIHCLQSKPVHSNYQ